MVSLLWIAQIRYYFVDHPVVYLFHTHIYVFASVYTYVRHVVVSDEANAFGLPIVARARFHKSLWGVFWTLCDRLDTRICV